jgi:mono/diheme cytochrome c family protein
MSARILFIVVMACAGVSLGQGGARTVRDRVYSEEQAAKGKTSYDNQCSTCHEGGGMGPALKGTEFLASWEKKTLRSLYSRILTTMPSDAPGTLSEQEVLDIVTYLISANGFPPGDKALEKPDELNDITIVSPE